MYSIARAGILIAASIVAGCGFQLRGEQRVSDALRPIVVQGLAENHTMRLALENAFDGDAKKARDNTASVLKIISYEESEHVMAVDPTGGASDKQLFSALVYRFDGADGRTTRSDEKLVVSRFFQFDSTNVLGLRSEQDMVRREMRQEMVERVVRVLAEIKL